jgi:hypothetical protein
MDKTIDLKKFNQDFEKNDNITNPDDNCKEDNVLKLIYRILNIIGIINISLIIIFIGLFLLFIVFIIYVLNLAKPIS